MPLRTSPSRSVLLTIWLVPLALLVSSGALADEPLATLRIRSLDAVQGDIDTVADAVKLPMESDQLVWQALSTLGLSQVDWIDRSRPLVLALPMQGMMLGSKGLVAAIPVSESESAIEALTGLFSSYDVEETRHTFARNDGTTIVVETRDGYLVGSANASLLGGFDLDEILAGGDLPPGNLSLEVHLEPLAPMLNAGLEQGRQALRSRFAKDATMESDDDSPSPDYDPEALDDLMDVYFDLVQDATRNVSRIQLSLEITPEHAILHKRLVPIGGSTLAELVAAQSGGFPSIARLVQVDQALIRTAGNVALTRASREAIKGYFNGYLRAMGNLVGSVPPGGPFSAQFKQVLTATEPLVGAWLECTRGDYAAAWAMDAESGFRGVQVFGAEDRDACASALADSASLLGEMPASPDGVPLVSMTPNALSHSGVNAYMTETSAAFPDDGEDTEEIREAMTAMFGGERFVGFTGLAGDVMLSAMGAGAEQNFQLLVNRSSKKIKKLGDGLRPADFSPLSFGPGFFVSVDMVALYDFASGFAPEDDVVLPHLADLPAGAGRVVYGARLDGGSMTVQAAVPFPLIRAFRETVAEE